jgi:2-oxoisovalerate dehydrogenase E2 component (dihydrolipoyl transacylase)
MKIFHLPDLGEGLAEAEIREWYVKVGDEVKVDQPLVSMETAKAVVDVPSPYAGKIITLHGNANDIVKTGAPLITYEIEGAPVQADKGSVVGKLETSEQKWDDGDVVIGAAKPKTATIKAMPAARVLAQQMNIDLSLVKATGPQGLITANDVKNFMDSSSASSVTLTGNTEPLRGVRRVMAQIMAQSHKEVVPVTIVEDVDLTDLPPKTDITVRLLKAIVAACKEEPALNAWFDGKALERKVFDEVHIGIAVDSAEGLFVPVIKNAETRSDAELRQMVDDYKKTVSDRSVSPKDLAGGTITLSNFGTIAGRYATPIIVPPTVAILGCGRSRETAIVRNGQIVAGKIMPLSLTFDHRAATGGEATRFLGAVIKHLKA